MEIREGGRRIEEGVLLVEVLLRWREGIGGTPRGAEPGVDVGPFGFGSGNQYECGE